MVLGVFITVGKLDTVDVVDVVDVTIWADTISTIIQTRVRRSYLFP